MSVQDAITSTDNAAVVRRGYYCCIVFEVEDGRITDGREHFYDLHAWDDFWS